MNELRTFQEFENIADAEDMAAILKQHDIDGRVEKYNPLLDQNIIGKQYNEYIQLKLAPGDFDKARKVLIDATNIDMDKVDRHYMLFSLSDKELMEVIAKPDEWGVYNYKLAQLILKERNVSMPEEAIAQLKQEHEAELHKPKSVDGIWIFLCYFFPIIIILGCLLKSSRVLNTAYAISFFPGFFSVIVGSRLMRAKKTLPDGRLMWTYNKRLRIHGRIMFYLGLLAFVLAIYTMIMIS